MYFFFFRQVETNYENNKNEMGTRIWCFYFDCNFSEHIYNTYVHINMCFFFFFNKYRDNTIIKIVFLWESFKILYYNIFKFLLFIKFHKK